MGFGRAIPQNPTAYDTNNVVGNAAKRLAIRARMQDAGFRFKITAFETAAGLTEANLIFGYEPGNVLRYGADSTGVVDASTAFQNALNQYMQGGEPVYIAAGLFRINVALTYNTTSGNTFTQSLIMRGAGRAQTILDTRVANGFLLTLSTSASLKYQVGGILSDFEIKTNGAPVVAGGISIDSAYHLKLENIWITGLSGDGIRVNVISGDVDGPNQLIFKHCRIESCATWGINCNIVSGHNELSFFKLQHCFIQSCGTSSPATFPPTSGGMTWRGQNMEIEHCAFTLNLNVGLHIQGAAGLGNTGRIRLSDFENNITRHVAITGVQNFSMQENQLFSNDTNVATTGIIIDGTSFVCKNIRIDGTIVRATTNNNAYTAFTVQGANANFDTIRVTRVTWDNFDYAGQARFNGVLFDPIIQECEFVVLGTALARFRPKQTAVSNASGNISPLRLRGGGGGTPSTTGEWIAAKIATLSVTNAALAATTLYYCYLYDNNGSNSLELSTTVPVIDASTGYSVKTGDVAKLLVGWVQTDGASNFLTTSPVLPGVPLGRFTVPYSAAMTFDASLATIFDITATNGTAFTINNPLNPRDSQEIILRIRNQSGGALGVATFGAAFKLAAWVQPANANSRGIHFTYDGSVWVESARTPADVPN